MDCRSSPNSHARWPVLAGPTASSCAQATVPRMATTRRSGRRAAPPPTITTRGAGEMNVGHGRRVLATRGGPDRIAERAVALVLRGKAPDNLSAVVIAVEQRHPVLDVGDRRRVAVRVRDAGHAAAVEARWPIHDELCP